MAQQNLNGTTCTCSCVCTYTLSHNNTVVKFIMQFIFQLYNYVCTQVAFDTFVTMDVKISHLSNKNFVKRLHLNARYSPILHRKLTKLLLFLDTVVRYLYKIAE